MPRRVQLMPLEMALVQEMGEPGRATFGAVMRTLSRRFRGEAPKARDAHINRQLIDWAGDNPRTKKPYDVRTAQHWTQSYRASETEKQRLKKSRNYLEPKGVVLTKMLKGSGLDVYIRRLYRLERYGAQIKMRATFDNGSLSVHRAGVDSRHRTIGQRVPVLIAPIMPSPAQPEAWYWWQKFIGFWRTGEVGRGRELCGEDFPPHVSACDAFQEAFWLAMGGYSTCIQIYDVEWIDVLDAPGAQQGAA